MPMRTEAEVREALEILRLDTMYLHRTGTMTDRRMFGMAQLFGTLAWVLGMPEGEGTTRYLATVRDREGV